MVDDEALIWSAPIALGVAVFYVLYAAFGSAEAALPMVGNLMGLAVLAAAVMTPIGMYRDIGTIRRTTTANPSRWLWVGVSLIATPVLIGCAYLWRRREWTSGRRR